MADAACNIAFTLLGHVSGLAFQSIGPEVIPFIVIVKVHPVAQEYFTFITSGE
jgi:hypothetical protein